MRLTTSIHSIARSFQAPSNTDLAEYGANHLNDEGKRFLYNTAVILTLGLAQLYERYGMTGLEEKEEDLVAVIKNIKAALNEEPENGETTNQLTIPCKYNDREVKLILTERSLRETKFIELAEDGSDDLVTLKNTDFTALKNKLNGWERKIYSVYFDEVSGFEKVELQNGNETADSTSTKITVVEIEANGFESINLNM